MQGVKFGSTGYCGAKINICHLAPPAFILSTHEFSEVLRCTSVVLDIVVLKPIFATSNTCFDTEYT